MEMGYANTAQGTFANTAQAQQNQKAQDRAPRQPGLVDTVAQEAVALISATADAARRLEDLADRLLGTVPTPIESEPGSVAIPVGIHAISAMVGAAHLIAQRLHRVLNRLDAL